MAGGQAPCLELLRPWRTPLPRPFPAPAPPSWASPSEEKFQPVVRCDQVMTRRRGSSATRATKAMPVAISAPDQKPSPAARPTAATTHREAAVVRPFTPSLRFMIAPPPRNPIPAATYEAIRLGSKLMSVLFLGARKAENAPTDRRPNSAEPNPSSRWVLTPASWRSNSRSSPTIAPNRAAAPSLKAVEARLTWPGSGISGPHRRSGEQPHSPPVCTQLRPGVGGGSIVLGRGSVVLTERWLRSARPRTRTGLRPPAPSGRR